MKLHKMQIGFFDRIAIAQILPNKDTREVGRVILQIKKKLAPAKKTFDFYKVKVLRSPDGGIQYNYNKKKREEVSFTPLEFQIVFGSLQKLEKSGNLPVADEWHSLHDKFCTSRGETK